MPAANTLYWSAAMEPLRICPDPTCGRVGDDIGQCGREVTCSARLGAEAPFTPTDGSVVILSCSRCNVRLGVTAARLLSGKPWQPSQRCTCGEDHSRAVAMVPGKGAPKRATKSNPALALPFGGQPAASEGVSVQDLETAMGKPADSVVVNSDGSKDVTFSLDQQSAPSDEAPPVKDTEADAGTTPGE